MAEDKAAFRPPSRVALVGEVNEAVEVAAAHRPDWQVARCTPARALADDCRADAFVLAADSDVATLLPELRSRSHSRRAAILCLFEDADVAAGAHALDARATDAIPLCASGEEVALRLERALQRKSSEDALRRQTDRGLTCALSDPLTGLHNRRYAEAYLEEMLQSPEASHKSYCAMMIDLDRFKEVNDTEGHAAGDAILRLVAHVLKDNLRSLDMVARLGGDEFLVVMPGTTPAEAGQAAERLRTRFAAEVKRAGCNPDVTLSIGVVAARAGSEYAPETVPALLAAADGALYSAKAEGRNCVKLTEAA